ncbi:MAG: hypothetical protein WB820_22825 [Rhodoplanes sp.]|jgi:hypothetical protein
MTNNDRPLDVKIADALADQATPPETFSDLLIAIEEALPKYAQEIEAAKVKLLDPTIPSTLPRFGRPRITHGL